MQDINKKLSEVRKAYSLDTFLGIIGNMKKVGKYNVSQSKKNDVKGGIGESVFLQLFSYYLEYNNIRNWSIYQGIILSNPDNPTSPFLTEIDIIIVTPYVVSIVECKSYNGEKVLKDKCTLSRSVGNSVDVYSQNLLHCNTFWKNFRKYAKTSQSMHSVLFSFSDGDIVDQRDLKYKRQMPFYTETSIFKYFDILKNINLNPPRWEVSRLNESLIRNKAIPGLRDKHYAYVKSLHKDSK